jgi:hypothetical protein
MRCGRLMVGVWTRDLAIEFRRCLNGESLSGGWSVGRETLL